MLIRRPQSVREWPLMLAACRWSHFDGVGGTLYNITIIVIVVFKDGVRELECFGRGGRGANVTAACIQRERRPSLPMPVSPSANT